jgi:hypothetical protein
MELEERRAWLERQVGREILDPLWDELVQSRYAKAGEMDEDEEELLVEQAKFGLAMRRRNVPDYGMSPRRFSTLYDVPSWMDSYHDVRREVFAKCVAYVAEDHPEVRSFRSEVLGDSYPLTYDKALRYVDEGGRVREDAPHARRLEDLTKILAKTFLWRADDASWFVLYAHYAPPLITFSVEPKVTRSEHGPEIATITLTVEPWLPSEIVVDEYKKAQRKILGKKPHSVSTNRLRVLELVETIGADLSWRELMDLWNDLYTREPDEQYKDRSNFRKAYKEVRAVVLEPGYTIPEHDEEAAREDRRRRDIKRKLKNIDSSLRVIRQVERAQRIVREATGEDS